MSGRPVDPLNGLHIAPSTATDLLPSAATAPTRRGRSARGRGPAGGTSDSTTPVAVTAPADRSGQSACPPAGSLRNAATRRGARAAEEFYVDADPAFDAAPAAAAAAVPSLPGAVDPDYEDEEDAPVYGAAMRSGAPLGATALPPSVTPHPHRRPIPSGFAGAQAAARKRAAATAFAPAEFAPAESADPPPAYATAPVGRGHYTLGDRTYEVEDVQDLRRTGTYPYAHGQALRQDGRRFEGDPVRYHEDWQAQKLARKKMVQADPMYRFLQLVAQRIHRPVETMYDTDNEMIDMWRQRLATEAIRNDASIERTQAANILNGNTAAGRQAAAQFSIELQRYAADLGRTDKDRNTLPVELWKEFYRMNKNDKKPGVASSAEDYAVTRLSSTLTTLRTVLAAARAHTRPTILFPRAVTAGEKDAFIDGMKAVFSLAGDATGGDMYRIFSARYTLVPVTIADAVATKATEDPEVATFQTAVSAVDRLLFRYLQDWHTTITNLPTDVSDAAKASADWLTNFLAEADEADIGIAGLFVPIEARIDPMDDEFWPVMIVYFKAYAEIFTALERAVAKLDASLNTSSTPAFRLLAQMRTLYEESHPAREDYSTSLADVHAELNKLETTNKAEIADLVANRKAPGVRSDEFFEERLAWKELPFNSGVITTTEEVTGGIAGAYYSAINIGGMSPRITADDLIVSKDTVYLFACLVGYRILDAHYKNPTHHVPRYVTAQIAQEEELLLRRFGAMQYTGRKANPVTLAPTPEARSASAAQGFMGASFFRQSGSARHQFGL